MEACKKIGYEFYCEELFVVKHRSQHNCESAIYFDSNTEIIKENCEFQYFYNKTDVKPAILDGGNEMILANWPKSRYVICKDNHEYPIKIPRHPYILFKRSVLCNCDIHAEEHSLLESIATCPGKQSDMTIYYTINTAFMPCLDTFKEESEIPSLEVNQNWTTQKQVLPILLQATPFNSKLLKAPGTLKGLVQQYKQKSKMLDEAQNDKPNSNTVTIMLFFSDIRQYVPVKLCKSAGSIHLFQIYGQLDSDQIILEKNCLWDMIKIDWKEVFVTFNGTIIRMPKMVKVPLRNKYRLRTLIDKHSLLPHIMLRQGTSWYALDKRDSKHLLPPPLQESKFTFTFQNGQ